MVDRSDRFAWQSCHFEAEDHVDDHNLVDASDKRNCLFPFKLRGSMNYDDGSYFQEDVISQDNSDTFNETYQTMLSSHTYKSNTMKANSLEDKSFSEKCASSEHSTASNMSVMLSELLLGESQTLETKRSKQSFASFRRPETEHGGNSLSEHLTRGKWYRDDDHLSSQRSVFTRESDLSGLLSELLAASIIPEDEFDDDDEGRMPLLYEDEEYFGVHANSTTSPFNTNTGQPSQSDYCDHSISSDMTGLLSEILTSKQHFTHQSTLGSTGCTITSPTNKDESEIESGICPVKSILGFGNDFLAKSSKQKKGSKERKKSKQSKRHKRERRLKKKALAEAAVVDSLRVLIEGQIEMNEAKRKESIVASPRKLIPKAPLSPSLSELTPRISNSTQLASPTSVNGLSIHPLSTNHFDHTPSESQPLEVGETSPSSPQHLFSILPESVQNCLLLLHQQWLVSTSQISETPIHSIPYPVDGDHKSVTSDISGLSSVLPDASSKSPRIHYPGVEYRVEIDGEENEVTCLWFQAKNTEAPKQCRLYRKVTFDTVGVREYETILGDNPSCHDGPSLSIGWKYARERVYGIDIFDNKPARRHGEHLILSRQDREESLLKLGYTRQQLDMAIMARFKVRHERQGSKLKDGVKEFDEILAGAGRKLNRYVSNLNLEEATY